MLHTRAEQIPEAYIRKLSSQPHQFFTQLSCLMQSYVVRCKDVLNCVEILNKLVRKLSCLPDLT